MECKPFPSEGIIKSLSPLSELQRPVKVIKGDGKELKAYGENYELQLEKGYRVKEVRSNLKDAYEKITYKYTQGYKAVNLEYKEFDVLNKEDLFHCYYTMLYTGKISLTQAYQVGCVVDIEKVLRDEVPAFFGGKILDFCLNKGPDSRSKLLNILYESFTNIHHIRCDYVGKLLEVRGVSINNNNMHYKMTSNCGMESLYRDTKNADFIVFKKLGGKYIFDKAIQYKGTKSEFDEGEGAHQLLSKFWGKYNNNNIVSMPIDGKLQNIPFQISIVNNLVCGKESSNLVNCVRKDVNTEIYPLFIFIRLYQRVNT